MSPRAACRLELLGFTQVYDYAAGKADWLAHGLPSVGEQAQVPRAKDVLRREVVTTLPWEPVGVVAARVARSPYGFALVVANDGTLLGRLRKAVLDADPSAPADQVMEAGPSTVRPDRPLGELAERLRRRGLHTAIVTAPDGKLLGVAQRADMEARLASQP
jgi:CBS-domain-containing membrane protein